MPSISDKLKKLGVQIGASDLKTPKKVFQPSALIDSLQGSWEKTSQGDCFVVRKVYPLSFQHGSRKLGDVPDLNFLEALHAYSGISHVPINRFLFIDTETTGLSGGAGTYVFLVGVAKLEEDGIHFAQFFLQDPANEPCQLAALEDYASNTEVLVSYNGKSFDLPRIKNRYRFHGWPAPFQDVFHIDLLHIARRLWKNHLSSCALGDIEYHLLGLERESHDIPGWQVSEKFFEYLQTGDPIPLQGVFYHNEVDVISLITLLSYISERISTPLFRKHRNNHDLISIANYLSDLGHTELALDIFNHTFKIKSLPENLLLTGLKSTASIHKRLNDFPTAVPLWKKAADLNDLRSNIELAMHYEHREKDFEEAIHWTLSALTLCEDRDNDKSSQQDKLNHRLERLKSKLKSQHDSSAASQ